MADPNSDVLSFEGTNPKECEAFVSAIRRRALEQGKHRDNEWMAVFASSCFAGDAFYWYEELDDDVQNDWSRLRPALVARFGRGSTSPILAPGVSMASAFPLSLTIPTPAAAPPIAGSLPWVRKVRTGWLKVFDHNGGLRGYVARSTDIMGVYDSVTTGHDGALSVSFTVLSTDQRFEIKVVNTSQPSQGSIELAIAWCHLTGNEWMTSDVYAAKLCSPLVKKSREWARERNVWQISEDGELSVEYPKPGGGAEKLQCSTFGGSGNIMFLRPSRTLTRNYARLRLVFEDSV